MILGIGTDIVDVARIAQKVEGREDFMKKVFSEQEAEYCKKQANPAESFAARFAAKEAFLKALGKGLDATFELHQIEIRNQENGKPYLELSSDVNVLVLLETEQNPYRLHVSLSHTKTHATAHVIIEVD